MRLLSLYRIGQGLIRIATPLLARLEIVGRENVPRRGPFLLVANHQSYLDPPLIQAVLWRPVYTMTKSTQFSDPLTGALLRRVNTFPVRRFEVDPQAVRLVLRRLQAGDAVGLYVEGERTWDGRLQPPRLGALRLILKAGVPVLPCGISGAYDIWPRWDRRLRRGRIRIAFGEPLLFPQMDAKADRERALPDVADRLMSAIEELSGATRAPVKTP